MENSESMLSLYLIQKHLLIHDIKKPMELLCQTSDTQANGTEAITFLKMFELKI